MINQHFYIARLIARYLSDEIEEEEQAELTRWRNESSENERLFREICKEENIKQNMQKRQTFHTEDVFENLRGLHFHIGIIRHLGEILHQEINILLDSPDGSFQRGVVDSRVV